MILVTGATGNAGGATVEALAASGEPVRAVSREERDWPDGVEGATGDLNRAESLVPALAGAEAVFLMSGYEGMEDLLAAAREAGVRRVVLLSSSSVPAGDMDNAMTRYHVVSERAVKDSGLDWTMLQPNSFMTNTLQWAPQLREGDVVSAPFADVAVATIDPADIGAVAAAALSRPGHEGQSYRLSGPESLLPADRLRILAGVLDRDLRLDPQSDAGGARGDERLHARRVRGRADVLLRRRQARRVRGAPHGGGGSRQGARQLRELGHGERRRLPLSR